MITLHQFEVSPFCDKVRRILHVKRVPYRIEEIPPSRAVTAVRKLNPAGKLPCVTDDGHVVCDSTDIAYYLEERYPEPRLVPDDPRLRALCHVLEDWADESLYFYELRLRFTLPHNARRFIPHLVKYESALMQRVAPFAVPPLMRRTAAGQGVGRKPLDVLLRDVERHLDAVAGLLGDGAFLLGDRLTLADIAVFAQLSCIAATDEGTSLVATRATVGAWLERVEGATAPAAAEPASAARAR